MPNQLQNDRFRTYDQQIDILKNQKGLIISDETITKESLINIGYFSLIGGYKYPFKNPMTRKYINTTFEDIYALYKFDRELRELTFKYLCEVEMKIRQVISYCFCQHHGDSQTHYISTASYRSKPKYARDIAVLTNILSKIAIRDTDHSYLVHQRNAHQNVPLWVAVNALTFGQISKMYSLLPFSLQSAVAQEYPHVNEKELEQFFAREAAIGSDTHVGFGGFISRIELVIQKLRSAMQKVLEEVVLPAFRIRRIHVDTSGFLRYSGNILFQHFRAFLHLPEFFLTGLAARIGKQFPHHSVCAMTTHTRQFVAEAGCRA